MARTNNPEGSGTIDRLVNVGTVAKHLAVSRSKVYQLLDAGELPYVKLGKSRRVRWSDVLTLIDKHLVGCGT